MHAVVLADVIWAGVEGSVVLGGRVDGVLPGCRTDGEERWRTSGIPDSKPHIFWPWERPRWGENEFTVAVYWWRELAQPYPSCMHDRHQDMRRLAGSGVRSEKLR